MITEAEKRKLIDWISTLENQSLLEQLMELKKSSETEKIHIVSNVEREGIERGLNDLKDFRLKSQEDVKKEIKSKYPRFFE